MLLNVITGYRGIQKRPKHEIIMFVASVDTLTKTNRRCFFTDGQANASITKHYSDLTKLCHVDWDSIGKGDFKRTEDDKDKRRRY